MKIQLSPNQTRIVYDSFIAFAGASFVFFFFKFSFHLEVEKVLFLTPPFLMATHAIFGIFTKFRVGTGRVKTPLLTASLLLTSGLAWLFGQDISSIFLWFCIVWAPIVLPRIFLHLHRRPTADFVSTTMRQRGPILVVGGAGYIGSHVVDQLLKSGEQVRVLDRFMYGHEPLNQFIKDSRLEIIEGDVTDITKLVMAMTGVSAVVHLAGLVGDPACAVDESFTRHTNVIATKMVKDVAMSLGVPRFVFASSCSVYGSNEKEVNELSSLNPVSLYAQTKIDSERELLRSNDETFSVTILRFATVFGHSRRPRFDLVANLFTAQAWNEGKIFVTGENQWRPFIHVQDLARAIVLVLKAPESKVSGQVFNVGDENLNVTIGKLGEIVHSITSKEKDVELVIKNDITDKRNYFVSFDKIKSVLGFRAQMSVEEGIKEIVQEFKKGTYTSFREPLYSNVEITKLALDDFRDPVQSSKLYSPLVDKSGDFTVTM